MQFDDAAVERGSGAGLGVAITVALHVGAAAALLAYEPARTSLLAAAPIMVHWIAPPAPPKRESHVRPPRPRPVVERPVIPPPPAPLITSTAAPLEPAAAPAPIAPGTVSAPVEAPPLVPAAPEVTPPVFYADYLKNPAPAYPAQSRRLGEQGRVVLRVLVNAAGAAQEVQIRTSSGFPRLDDAARETVRQWKFSPARRGAEAMPAWVLIPIQFTLDS